MTYILVSNFIKIFPKGGANKIKNFPNSKISQLEGGRGGVRKFGNVSQIIPMMNYEGFP